MSHTTPLIMSTQPRARIEKVVAVWALPIQITPRTVKRMPQVRNHPQDFLTCSRLAAKTSLSVDIVFLLLIYCAVGQAALAGWTALRRYSSMHENFCHIVGNNNLG